MKKRGIWLFIISAIALIGLGLFFAVDKVSVSASSLALAEQGWRANFSSALNRDAIEKGDLYLTDSEGKPVEVEMVLHKNGKTIEVPSITPGAYQLHIKEAAVKGKLLKSLDTKKVAFVVQEKLNKLANEDELKAYFAQLLDLQKKNGEPGAIFSEESAASEESADSSASAESGSGGDFSTTNNQVEGVDEADMVKTDGSFIYSISGPRVVISDVRNPDEMAVAEELTFTQEMYPQQLFLSGDVLAVLGSQYSDRPMYEDIMEFHPQTGLTSAYLYNVSNPESPELIREFGTEGTLNGARLANGILYFVTNAFPDFRAMEQGTGGELRPHAFDSKKTGALQPLAYDSITILPGTMSASYSIISAIDLSEAEKNDIVTEGFLGSSEQLYMTEENLYLTASAYMPISEEETDDDLDMSVWLPQQANTKIFKFALDGIAVEFAASSEVTGTLLNQFSMDEHNGYFRVVTTEGFAWDEAAPSKNHLFVLDGGLKQVGSVEDLAPGERIYSARFMGDKAYLVTFKETDPLFVIDVSAPSAPKVLGELKIPGFSNYLHPLGEDHLIGFGYDTKLEPVKGQEPRVVTGGMKISLFDVSDFAKPVEKDTEIIGGPGTYSALQYDHKALFTHTEKNLYGFPVSLFRETGGDYVEFEAEGAMIYSITSEGIEEAGNLLNEANAEFENWETSIQRIIYIEDTLYTIASEELKSYDLETFELKNTLKYN
ncbi:beta-propeller domain-containing protein [Planococcus sp. YIM B11945]|uniref:beta-propeller domain-containing protein n=1 Tax=Planococcus sp. YIM B11945 TaxID=3435410 RepID=UPI003D7C3761